MTRVERLWPNATVVCLGGGPSLTADDVEACRGRARVIAVNDAHRLAPWADVLYSSDVAWWRFYNGVPDFAGQKFSIDQGNRRILPRFPEIRVLANTGDTGVETNPTGLRTLSNSGGAAINLAVHFGATRVILLGYDMRPGHWFGKHPCPLNNHSPYVVFRQKLATMAAPLKALGVDIVNCSRATALTAFRIAPLADVLEQVAA